MKLFEQINNAILRDSSDIDKETLDYYEQNPRELELMANKEHFNSLFLGLFFLLGILVTFSARIVQYYYQVKLGPFVSGVVLDLLSELGIAIFGGAVVAYIIEFLNKRQYRNNVKFKKLIQAKLTERKDKEI